MMADLARLRVRVRVRVQVRVRIRARVRVRVREPTSGAVARPSGHAGCSPCPGRSSVW